MSDQMFNFITTTYVIGMSVMCLLCLAGSVVFWLRPKVIARRAYNNRIYADDEPHFIEPVPQWCPRGDG